MQKSFLEKVKTFPKFWWIFLAILIVGIFLRIYMHHDWLRFNADQGRDAQIVSSVADGSAPWPLLGPKAGGTKFRLGAAFYYFEIVSAKIFGNSPDKMAYPDLFTGILSIPLLFFFLRKYFERYSALAMSAIFAVSAYAIYYARFAWNPNSTPFWTLLFLYAAHEVVCEKKNRKLFWAVLAGAAMGIGVQLHTTLLVILPATAVTVFAYFSYKKKKVLKYFLAIVILSLLINTPQLISEHRTSGANLKAFFGGVNIKNKAENSILNNAVHNTSCWIQGNIDMVSGYEISDTCAFDPARNAADTSIFLFGLLFVLGGLIIGFKYFFKETEADRKSFLAVMFVFVGISFLVYFKFAFELSMRFYLPLVFLPYVFLGFWLRFFRDKLSVRYNLILLAAGATLIFSNLFFVQKSFARFANYSKLGGGDVNVTILKEADEFSNFIIANSGNKKEVYISGDKEFLHKAYTPLKYLVGRSNIKLSLLKNLPLPDQSFQVVSQKKKKKMILVSDSNILQYKDYGGFSMLLVTNNGSQQ